MDGLAGALAIALGIYLIGFWAPRRLRANKDLERLQSEEERTHRMKHSAESIKVELHEVTREMIAKLDTKILFLKELTNRADEVAARLETAVKSAEAASSMSEMAPEVEQDKDEKFAEANSEILALHEDGKDLTEIAEITGQPVGEIQLILGLQARRKNRESA